MKMPCISQSECHVAPSPKPLQNCHLHMNLLHSTEPHIYVTFAVSIMKWAIGYLHGRTSEHAKATTPFISASHCMRHKDHMSIWVCKRELICLVFQEWWTEVQYICVILKQFQTLHRLPYHYLIIMDLV